MCNWYVASKYKIIKKLSVKIYNIEYSLKFAMTISLVRYMLNGFKFKILCIWKFMFQKWKSQNF